MSASRWLEQIIEGDLAPDQAGEYHLVPFEMPASVQRLEISYTYDHPIGADPHLAGGNTLDIGLFDARGANYPGPGFRGWTGSARQHFFISPEEATPGYLAGPLMPGTWHVALGFYKSAPQGCHYTLTLRFLQGGGETPPAAFPPRLTLATSQTTHPKHPSGWYRGELHCHSHHSDGDSPPEALIAQAMALGLDFLAITDHNALSHLVDLARQPAREIMLIPGCEVTTYRGHWNVWGLEEWIDFRTLTPERMQAAIARAAALGYLTSCNHPRPMGPDWEFPQVGGTDCVEVWNGPWRLFNEQAVAFWEARLRRGERLVAVGGSDAHFLNRPHHAAIGTPTTWVYTPDQPTASALLAAIRAGHCFIADTPDGPQIAFHCGRAMMGDTTPRPASGQVEATLHVQRGQGLLAVIYGAQGVLASAPITTDDQSLVLTVPVDNTPYVRVELQVEGTDPRQVRALSNPIYFTSPE